jgi:hypothetical protein
MSVALKSVSALLSRTRSAGQELRDGVEGIRSKVAKLKAKKVEIESLPPTLDVALARVDGWVEHITYATRQRMIEPEHFVQSPLAYVAPGHPNLSDNFFAYLAPMFGEVVKKRVDDVYQNTAGITETERQKQLDAVDRDLLDAELAEESIIRAAEASGFPVLRRSNADPRAVLAADEALP